MLVGQAQYHPAMPKSKGRDTKSKKRPYVPKPPPKKKAPKTSPKWFGRLVLGCMLLGIAAIVANYMNIMPGGFSPVWLWGGLALVGTGFLLATRLR